MLLTRRPAQPLAAFVEALWYFDGGEMSTPRSDRVLPNGRFQIVIGLATNAGAVSGMRSHHVVVSSGAMAATMGVVFRPGGARGFFAFPANDFYNRAVSLDDVWPEVPDLRDRLVEAVTPRAKFQILERVLLGLLQGRSEKRIGLHPSVQHGLQNFWRMPHIATVMTVAKEAGLSRRRFGQLFDEQVGMTPKLYCRLLRFRAVVRQVGAGARVNWADVALSGGYYDQAHLTHEFRQFSGMSPSRFVVAERPHLNHIRIQ
jgi:AraC-like DNA-binding protein